MTQIATIRNQVTLRSHVQRVAPVTRSAGTGPETRPAQALTSAAAPVPKDAASDNVIEFVPVEKVEEKPHVMFTAPFTAQVIGQVSGGSLNAANENHRLHVVNNYAQAGTASTNPAVDVKS